MTRNNSNRKIVYKVSLETLNNFFFKSELTSTISTNFEKKNSKAIELVPKLTYFEIFFQSSLPTLSHLIQGIESRSQVA